MKRPIYLIALLLFLSSCSSKSVEIKRVYSLYGSWHTKTQKQIDKNIRADITIKEQFFRDGRLISTKWFDFKDRSGRDLGEYYITKEFRFSRDNKIIKAKFIRCKTGITKPLSAKNLGYKELFNMCQRKKSYKITAKEYKIIGNKLYIQDRVYIKESLF